MDSATDPVKNVATRAALSGPQVKKLLAALARLTGRRLLEGERVTWPGLGTVNLATYQARRVTDISRPGRTIVVPAHRLPTLRPIAELRGSLRRVKPTTKPLELKAVASPVRGVEFVSLADRSIAKDLLGLLPEGVMRRYQVVPIAKTDTSLTLAMIDPENQEAIELVKKVTGLTVTPALTTQADLAAILDRLGGGAGGLAELAEEAEGTIEALPEAKPDAAAGAEEAALEHAPAAKVISQLIKRAVREGASDIHIEPGDAGTEIRIRVDGVLRHVATLPRAIQVGLLARVKVLTNLRLDEHRLPQDGRFRTVIDHGEIDFRVSILPTVDGEKAVLRILDKSAGIIPLEQLGLRGGHLEIFRDELNKSHGMILVTGPTGSGKTTTLYAAVDKLKSPTTNITTLEDPVEYRLSGINQSQVNTEIGYTFATGLRSILRQDPNIVLVGEIRDTETAEIAVHAALTGHIVLSTLHTNDAAGAIPRLIDMGVEPFLLLSSLNAVVAQRLVRQICTKCRQSVDVSADEFPEIKEELAVLRRHRELTRQLPGIAPKLHTPKFFVGRGCATCGQTGYKGRIGIYELLPVGETLRPLITTRTDSAQLAAAAIKAGMLTMRQDGVLKALDGLTTIEEVWRVTKI